jgi:hypothetical protein
MAHFAQLDEADLVVNVISVHNNELLEDGQEVEAKGIDFCKQLYGSDTHWVQTSYNGNIRKNYAGVGFSYDPIRDAFVPPQPFSSWVLNESTCQWEAPTPMPEDGNLYSWDEATLSWVKSENL